MKVKDLMVKLDEYATVCETATLEEALQELEEAQQNFNQKKYKHRAILVLNKDGKVVGKISQLQVLMALERREHSVSFSKYGYTNNFMDKIMNGNPLDLGARIEKERKKKVGEFMYTPSKGEYIKENSSLENAVHQLAIGQHHSLLVVGNNQNIVGIIRLVDVFDEVWKIMKKRKAE